MSFSSALVPEAPQFVTATKTIDLENHVPWIFLFSAYEEVEKFLKILRVVWADILPASSAGVPAAFWQVVGVTAKAYSKLCM